MNDMAEIDCELVELLAKRHSVSQAAVQVVMTALSNGGGRMAQFSHADFGGMSQWSPGMSMVGDMFNTPLKAKVCTNIAAHLQTSEARDGIRSTGALAVGEESVSAQSHAAALRAARFRRLVLPDDSFELRARLMRQNLSLAVGYNFLAVLLAIAGLATPLVAAAAMLGSSLLVILNALRAHRGVKELS